MNLRRRERKTGAVEVSPEESLTPSSAAVVVPVAAPAYAAPVEHQVPEWFKKGQEQAKKPAKEKPVQRSRYATALERAEEEINAREEHERRNLDELSERMRVMLRFGAGSFEQLAQHPPRLWTAWLRTRAPRKFLLRLPHGR